MKPFQNDESDDDSRGSFISADSDFNSGYDKLADDLDELQILSEYSTEKEMEVDSISGSHMGECGFTSISSNDVMPILVFKNGYEAYFFGVQ
ncbi:unnamed protein product [Adineta steineri]|uniref:Uncharacterized protein n=1 Tax=Adineta steineri TaxID=433720 RepID=A0A814P1C1_9BILA|nr:unnamed protein product [Adineta steineri]CAF3955733.1 unnamed protein product [Adineta steineri]